MAPVRNWRTAALYGDACGRDLQGRAFFITMTENPFTFENLCDAARECMKGVQWKNGTARWRMNLLANCRRLEKEIADGTYRLGKANTFIISSPKKRVVTSMLMRDRVVHKVICKHGGLIEDLFRNSFLDNTACQEGKGTSFAIRRLEHHLRRHFAKCGASGYVLELDIRHFFDSIPHDRLVDMVFRRVRNPITRKIVCDIINSYPGDTGIGLGSEVSQVMAKAFLTPVDFVIKQILGISGYVRYADNLIVLIPSANAEEGREKAKAVFDKITNTVGTMGLSLNPKSSMHPLSQGIHFLGFKWCLKSSGKIVRTTLRTSMARIRRKISRLVKMYADGRRTREQVMRSFESWAAYAINGMSDYRIRILKDKLTEAIK